MLTPVWATKSLRFLKLHANPYALSTETGRGQKRVTPYAATNYSHTEVVGFSMPNKSRVSLTSEPTSVVYVSGLLVASRSRLAVISSRRLASACPCVSVAVGMAPGGTAGAGAGNGAAGVGAAAGVSATRRRVSYRWVGAGAGAGASAITASPSLSGDGAGDASGAEVTGTEAIGSSDARKTQPTLGARMRTWFPLVAVTSTDVP